jgi:iron complex transport system ATP-binding protein
MNTPRPILELQGIRFGYTAADDVLHELTIRIESGTLTAILGPNGGGKTTLLHLLLGWLSPQVGTVRLDGIPLSGYSARERSRRIGLVPQSEFIPFDFTLFDYVLLGRAPYLGPLDMPGPADEAEAHAAIQRVGLTSLTGRPVTHMSGGERQLAMIARALAQRPAVLLLDEPTSHLDLANRRRVRDVLCRLTGDGITVICTTHDPALAAGMATTLILIRAGRIIAAGPIAATMKDEALTQTYGLPVRVQNVNGEWFITS